MELQDYSGRFRPGLKMEDFSKAALGRMWRLGGAIYLGLGGVYYRVLKERLGESAAMELDREAWRRMAMTEIRLSAEAMNVRGSDVSALFKLFQVDPAGDGMAILSADYDLKSEKHGIVTYKDCQSLRYFEKHAEKALYQHVCAGIDVDWYNQCARFVNPKIKVTPLKLPPRKSPEEIACRWEFTIEE
ncbi:MAG: DUF6125 family protein [Chloroflexi bacterium]|nr:DUF6125 family protein [Chloroflexota bacterium]